MSNRDRGWSWFSEPGQPDSTAIRPGQVDADLVRAFARCFRERDGERVLEHLRALTLERTLGPGSGDVHLRHLEGQRQLVAYILALVDRGRRGDVPAPCRDAA